MNRVFILMLLLFFTKSSFTQGVTVNYDIDTTISNIAEPLSVWLKFLETKDDSIGSQYWNKEEVERYGTNSYFLIENELQFGMPNYLQLLGNYTNVKVLSIRKVQEFFKITSIMEFNPKEGRSNVQYIFHVYGKEVDGEFKLYNPLAINTQLYLTSTTVGYIKFHYPKEHQFNLELAKKQNDFLTQLSTNFGAKIDTIDYYFAPTNEEIQKIKGFDFLIGDNGEQVPSGKADSKNRIVYSSGLGEYYPHEFIHILLNPVYLNCHSWFNEGVATYFGMSRGKELNWHLKRLNKHLIQHPEIDLNDMLKLRTLDQYTDYRYALGGFMIQKAYKKGSYDLVKKLMTSGRTNEEYYQAIEDHLGIKKADLNKVIREELKVAYEE